MAANESSVAEAEAVVELRNVTKRYHGVTAVQNLSLTLRRGEFFSLLGPSGCGKTTTLRMIGGFERVDRGTIVLMGRDVGRSPPNRRPVNTVFQSYALFPHLDIFGNVAFGLKEKRRPREDIRTAVTEALALVRLEGYETRRPHQLSGGQQQRVALARAIVNQPAVLLLDEPLGALDLKLRRAMQIELKNLQKQVGITFLYVTHDQEEALIMSDRIGVMQGGELRQIGSPEAIYNRPLSPYVADFVGEANMVACEIVGSSGDRVDLRFASGQLARGAGATSLADGMRAKVVIRPEKIDIAPAGDGGTPSGLVRLPGTLREQFFTGSHHRFVVELEVAQHVALLAPNRGRDAERLHVGDHVTVTWREDDAWVIPADD